MNANTTTEERRFRLTPEERSSWDENGYFIRYDVFTQEENDSLAQIADDIAIGKRPFPAKQIHQNALVRDGKVKATGSNAMHCIHHINKHSPEFLARTRDIRLTDPIVDLIGPDILGLNNLYIWKPPRIGLGFPWHQDKWYFNHQYITTKTVGTWTAIDDADIGNGCLYVIPGSHKNEVHEHVELEGSQQNEFKQALGARDEDGVAVEVPSGSVIFFNNQLLHKSTDNHSDHFRRCNVAHYICAHSERVQGQNRNYIRPVSWVRGDSYSKKMEPVYHDALPIPEEQENK
ncbi:MAG: phytanoyl-CoA dioxygenase family protein [Candidatus Poribacteria bacterium]|nr:phytanoyl-CoA dioxygenase family protein [Candidatus Poribacteria bacterium]